MKAFSKIVFILVLVPVLFACKKNENFSDIPYLEFTGYTIKDSVDALGNLTKIFELHLYFTDGDGDIGLFDEDTIPPFDYNLFVNYFEMYNDSSQQINVTPPYHIRIPNLTPTGQNKSLKVDVKYDVDITYRNSDTIKFELKLFDRALNESEWVSSGVIFIN
ncbi:MAG: hypothetical protein QGG97_02375 [Flavobacteriales bacterium]|jgi:hypothetical protein|nr:hypothetical protein [Flavobacteriales bacterium]HJN64233.1 hypothetical protein [Flavobacteriales bacterium]